MCKNRHEKAERGAGKTEMGKQGAECCVTGGKQGNVGENE